MYNYILYSTPASQVLHTKVYNSLFPISEYAGKYIKTLFFTHDDGTVNHILRHFNLNTRYEQYNEQYISQRHVGFRCTTAVSIASLFLFFLFVIIFLQRTPVIFVKIVQKITYFTIILPKKFNERNPVLYYYWILTKVQVRPFLAKCCGRSKYNRITSTINSSDSVTPFSCLTVTGANGDIIMLHTGIQASNAIGRRLSSSNNWIAIMINGLTR